MILLTEGGHYKILCIVFLYFGFNFLISFLYQDIIKKISLRCYNKEDNASMCDIKLFGIKECKNGRTFKIIANW